MVRHKTRWLLVKVDFEVDVRKRNSKPIDYFPSKKEVAQSIRESILSCFGTAAEGAAFDTQGMSRCFLLYFVIAFNSKHCTQSPFSVRLCDASTRLLLLRVPREFHGIVRSAITLMTSVGANNRPVVASVISANGSARTAKIATIAQVRRSYRENLKANPINEKELHKTCKALEDALSAIQNID
jgi:RNase P/RNase MRP subunit POP5